MKFVIGNDHGGIDLVDSIKEALDELGHEYEWVGTFDKSSCDYPDIAKKACQKVLDNEADFAILICGTGIGMSISANKINSIRACVVTDTYSAKMAREHNNSNSLCLGARVLGTELAKMIVKEFANAEFQGDRHQRRIDKISKLDEN